MLTKVQLQHTDLQVSRLCLGTNVYGTYVPQAQAHALLDAFAQAGGNFLDTARMYGDWTPEAPSGASERTVGAWLKGQRRADYVVATKGAGVDLRAGDYSPRVTPEAIAKDLQESLDHLQLDKIDLYWLHADDPSKPVEPIIDALAAHKTAGRIGWFGASNWRPERISEANAYARTIGSEGFVACQPFWGLATPNKEGAAAQGYGHYYEDAGFRELHAEGITMIPYAGQSRGVFTKMDEGGPEALPDALKGMYQNPENERRLPVLKEIAKAHGATLNQVVLAYLLSQPYPVIPIFGANRVEQIADSVQAADLKLAPEDVDWLRA
jgi:aryl-alcohol dehydrogenase-like predicted oxidoreductase